jgi:calcineurin-like phosphoesterase family protein
MSRVFFTSDTHFGHANIIKYCQRPFLIPADQTALANAGYWRDGTWLAEPPRDWRLSPECADLMDRVLIDEINARVLPGDVLWHLGDWSMAGRGDYYQSARAYRDQIACRTIHIVWGNHDRPVIRDLFQESHEQVQIVVEGQRITLNHYAMAVWEDSHKGAWQLYGHSHGRAESWLDAHIPGRRSQDVGVDNAARLLGSYRPWSFEELRARLAHRPGFAIDHHGARPRRLSET